MDENKIDLLNVQIDFPVKKLQRRRKLLPWWVVAFVWIFLVFFALMPVALVMGSLKYNFQISLLGLTTNQPISLIGLLLIAVFSLKGVTSLALWTEKTWAVGLAKIDAIVSMVVCVSAMAYTMLVLHSFSLRLELILLVLYYYKMNKIQYEWENFENEEPITQVTPEVL
ncbi:MAG: hypothetical protein ABI203_10295 [Mucilaginibacter sp.]